MASGRSSALAGYVDDRLSAGDHYFTSKEAEEAVGMDHGAFLDSAERLQLRNVLVTPRQGFYLIVGDYEYRGSPPGTLYVDALMRHAGADYYVGLLTAAGYHGASHQAVQVFQVVCNKQMMPITVGRTQFEFFHRNDVDSVSHAVRSRSFPHDGSHMRLSGPELTALDLLRYRKGSGSVHFVSTVLYELAPKMHPGQLAALSEQFEKPVLQRLGYHLEFLRFRDQSSALHAALESRGPLQWVNLRKRLAHHAFHSAQKPLERCERWRVEVCEYPDPDV